MVPNTVTVVSVVTANSLRYSEAVVPGAPTTLNWAVTEGRVTLLPPGMRSLWGREVSM